MKASGFLFPEKRMAFVHTNFGKPRDSTGMQVTIPKAVGSYSIRINLEKPNNSSRIRKKLGNPQKILFLGK